MIGRGEGSTVGPCRLTRKGDEEAEEERVATWENVVLGVGERVSLLLGEGELLVGVVLVTLLLGSALLLGALLMLLVGVAVEVLIEVMLTVVVDVILTLIVGV